MRAELKITYEEYAALPENGKRYQLVEGDLILSPAPTSRHQRITGAIFANLYHYNSTRRLGEVLVAPLDVILTDENVFQPDVVFVAKGGKARVVEEGIRGGPDLCVEVLSPSSRKIDLGSKKKQYAKSGVLELWIVDPEAASVSVFRLQEEAAKPKRVFKEDDTLVSELLPGFEQPLRELFAS